MNVDSVRHRPLSVEMCCCSFDVVFVLKDTPTERLDEELGNFVLSRHRSSHKAAPATSHQAGIPQVCCEIPRLMHWYCKA